MPKAGIAYVPQGRRLFAELTVAENLEIGLMARNKGEETRERVLGLFPILSERLNQRAGTLSGGEQQMLAMARALCLEPEVLLARRADRRPDAVDDRQDPRHRGRPWRARRRRRCWSSSASMPCCRVADRVAFIENGRIRETVDVARLREDPGLVKRYVGVA